MVRVKYRYILAEILSEQYKNKLKLPLSEHDLKQAILNSVELLHGDYGLACVQQGLSIKMYNPATRVFILRVRRKFHPLVGSSFPFVSSAGKLHFSLKTLKLSGTIRSASKFLVLYDKEKLSEMVKVFQDTPDIAKTLSGLMEKCHKRLAKKRLDVH